MYSAGPGRVKVVSVSELEKAKGPVPVREPVASKYLSGVEGTTKGTIIHELLRGRDAATVLKEYGEYSVEHVRQCEEIVSTFFSSDLMKRVKRSYCELPFVVTLSSGNRVTGKIDRLCELDDGSWVAIDYKSETSVDYAALAGEYALSLSVYVEAARQIVFAEITGWVYFTETGEFWKS